MPVKPAATVPETVPAQTPEQMYRELYQKLIQKQKMKKPKDTVAESRALCNEVTELVQQLKPILEEGVQKAQSSLGRLQKIPKPAASKSKRKAEAKGKAGGKVTVTGKHVTGKPKP